MSSKQQFKDAIKRDKELIRVLTTKNKILERELTRIRNILYKRSILPNTKVILESKRKWWQFWK